jgi:hypothetical protein
MKLQELKDKKITTATFKSFIKKSKELFVETSYSFNGMIDGIEMNTDKKLIPVEKENAIGHNGVWLVGSSRDYFTFVENETHFGIEVYNCCGCETLWTKK